MDPRRGKRIPSYHVCIGTYQAMILRGIILFKFENVPPLTTYLQSSAFEITQYYSINIIASISINRN